MKLCKITKENAEEFTGLFDDSQLLNDPVVGVGCVDDEEDPVGAAFLDSDGERLIISSLFVDEKSRRKGAGSLMLEGILEMSGVANTRSVDAYFMGEEAESFYVKNNFIVTECAPVYRVKAAEFMNLPSMDKHADKDGNVVCFCNMEKTLKDKLVKCLDEMGFMSLPEQYDQSLSFVYVDKHGNPVSFVLTNYLREEGLIRVEQFLNTKTDHPEYAIGILTAAISSLKEENVAPDTEIEFVSMNDKIYKFIEKATGGEEKIIDSGKLLHATCLTL